MAKVLLDQISRRFRTNAAIEQISFEVPDGQFWVLVGPSGCGKSTILRTIAGLEPVTEGNLYIGDRLMNRVAARDRDVAMVFQNYALYPHMTVAENLAFGLKMRGSPASEIQPQIDAVARSLQISHLLDRKPGQLSGGQQQRVALGRAIVRQPQVFLLDEPLSNLDAQLRDETRAELKQLHQQLGITSLYVTHDQVEAMTLADQIVVLKQGKIQQIGTPQQVYSQPANQMVATFLGNPPMNILPAVYREGQFHLGEQRLACPDRWQTLFQSGQPLNIGIRPEHLALTSPDDPDSLPVDVQLVEPLGREILVRSVLAGMPVQTSPTVQFQVMPSVPLRSGDRAAVRLDFEQVRLFDPQTGDRICQDIG
ncbi:ABC transporter ATP-binding protein [Leptolyngbya ohadii]|uniref:ABC transporter ATP-binding protein n=1 Tax=Leptolyngbya ohadii TaxID=1962290 RepID=UPI000B59EC8C|nr:sn-glycerol-3-phosphate ABC transporter ATP-binding protein UgpC [Leptolyngbya ohadii]